jgi:hypothetical protein
MSQPREKLQRFVEDGCSRGLEWAQTYLSEIDRDDMRGMCKAAGLAVLSNRKWRTVPELREALLAYLASELTKVGSCLTASCKDDMCLQHVHNLKRQRFVSNYFLVRQSGSF